MSRKIYRYRLHVTDVVNLDLPKGAKVLSVGPPRDDSDQLDLWALVDVLPDGLPMVDESRTFRIIGTGNPMPDFHGLFVGTVPMFNGALIFHVFEDVS